MRIRHGIRLKPMDTHLSPLHASRGHYTRRSGGESIIVTAARSLHLSTRGEKCWVLLHMLKDHVHVPADRSSREDIACWYVVARLVLEDLPLEPGRT